LRAVSVRICDARPHVARIDEVELSSVKRSVLADRRRRAVELKRIALI